MRIKDHEIEVDLGDFGSHTAFVTGEVELSSSRYGAYRVDSYKLEKVEVVVSEPKGDVVRFVAYDITTGRDLLSGSAEEDIKETLTQVAIDELLGEYERDDDYDRDAI